MADRDVEGYMTTPSEIPLLCADVLSTVVSLFRVEYNLFNIEYTVVAIFSTYGVHPPQLQL